MGTDLIAPGGGTPGPGGQRAETARALLDSASEKTSFERWAAELAESYDPDPLVRSIHDLGVPLDLARALRDTAKACALVADKGADPTSGRRAGGSTDGQSSAVELKDEANEYLEAVETLTSISAQLAEPLLAATRHLTATNGRILLAMKGTTTPEDLSRTARDRWRARAKSITRGEIAAATGWGRGETSDLVALANTPRPVLGPVRDGLSHGVAPWRLARSFHRASASLPHEHAAHVAAALFGSDPAVAVTERLDSEGRLTGRWHHREFYRALDREITKAKTIRDAADATPGDTTGDTTGDTDADATGDDEASPEAPPTGAAPGDRDRHLRASNLWVTMDPDGTAIVSFRCGASQAAAIADRIDDAARRARAAGDPRSLNRLRATIATALLLHGTLTAGDPRTGDPALIDVEYTDQLRRILDGLPAATLNILVPFTTLLPHLTPPDHPLTPPDHPPDRPEEEPARLGTGVGEVLGTQPHFLTGPQLRELALRADTSIHRILTDPATGRYVERTTTAYPFDGAMRHHITYADITCRAPGCTLPASQCQFDHVQEHGTPGGDTSEANGMLLHGVDHQRKTEKLWDAIIHANRDVTWTSLLGRIYRTRTHDFNQYSALLAATTKSIATSPPDEREEALDLAIYSALSYRPDHGALEADDDDADQERFDAWELVTLRHRDRNGRQRRGPHPTAAAAERRRMKDSATQGDHTGDGTTPTDSRNPWTTPPDEPPPF